MQGIILVFMAEVAAADISVAAADAAAAELLLVVAVALGSILLNPLLFHLADRYDGKATPETV